MCIRDRLCPFNVCIETIFRSECGRRPDRDELFSKSGQCHVSCQLLVFVKKGFECLRVSLELLIDSGNKPIVTRYSFQYRAYFCIIFFVHLTPLQLSTTPTSDPITGSLRT